MGELGSLLIRAREARGLTLEDAERDTRISRRYLQALESEQFEVIPAPVYARGFLRSDSHAQPQRASKETPVSPVSAARPTWRTPAPTQEAALPERRPSVQERPTSRNVAAPLGRPARKPAAPDPGW